MSSQNRWPEVHNEEIEAVNLSRFARLVPIADCSSQQEHIERAHATRLAGVALSGGGIRSATFNLGILQGFANLKLLHIFDYLSTVSGGGYIGSWLNAWIFRSLEAPETPEFTQEDFDKYNLKQLCTAIEKNIETINIKEKPQTLAWLNKLLEEATLYDQIIRKYKEFIFSKELQQLYEIINPPIRSPNWSIQPIKCLNRLILEEFYQDKIPASKKQVVDGPRETLNRVVGDLNTSGKEPGGNRSNRAQPINPKPWESQQIGFLRKYSNYLTPRRGFTTDTLTLGVAYTINFV
ncbi:MAG: patatin-like phospholipase family protein, partial [Deltaproteobacteria bacterium]|nr:patatin-like phospholipase family protein [Deltaproteobacteria bacterium]